MFSLGKRKMTASHNLCSAKMHYFVFQTVLSIAHIAHSIWPTAAILCELENALARVEKTAGGKYSW